MGILFALLLLNQKKEHIPQSKIFHFRSQVSSAALHFQVHVLKSPTIPVNCENKVSVMPVKQTDAKQLNILPWLLNSESLFEQYHIHHT
jgi:hypothetical protein